MAAQSRARGRAAGGTARRGAGAFRPGALVARGQAAEFRLLIEHEQRVVEFVGLVHLVEHVVEFVEQHEQRQQFEQRVVDVERVEFEHRLEQQFVEQPLVELLEFVRVVVVAVVVQRIDGAITPPGLAAGAAGVVQYVA